MNAWPTNAGEAMHKGLGEAEEILIYECLPVAVLGEKFLIEGVGECSCVFFSSQELSPVVFCYSCSEQSVIRVSEIR